jgi:AAA domain, putative AbiEii toxin, Type IV TA system/AAA domain
MAAHTPTVSIASLSIRDFRGIERLDLDFLGPDGDPNALVVLAGPNGCGKTAVLEAALILAGGSNLITGVRGRRATRRGARDYEIKADFHRDDRVWRGRDVSGLVKAHPPTENVPHWYFSSWRAPQLIGPVDATVGRRGRRPATNDQNRLLNVKQRLVNAATVERFENTLPNLGRYSASIEIINRAWRDFYPDADQTFAVEVAHPDDSGGAGTFEVYIKSQDGCRLEVDLLSSGQLELFLFLGELAMNEDREGIIFIDEPELHLDPQWHGIILGTLRRLQPAAQLIVATHSPEIYDAAMSYERHFLVRDDDPRSRMWAKRAVVRSGV